MTFRTPALLIASLLSLAAHAEPAPRQDLLAQCPALAEQIPELLATAKQELGTEAEVRVLLHLDGRGVQQVEAVSGPRRYLSRVRTALQGQDCRSATPQRQLLTIRFQEPRAEAPHTRLAAASTPR
ncbi:MAG: hypothetical protein U1E77_03215 [Inhella sp.]